MFLRCLEKKLFRRLLCLLDIFRILFAIFGYWINERTASFECTSNQGSALIDLLSFYVKN